MMPCENRCHQADCQLFRIHVRFNPMRGDFKSLGALHRSRACPCVPANLIPRAVLPLRRTTSARERKSQSGLRISRCYRNMGNGHSLAAQLARELDTWVDRMSHAVEECSGLRPDLALKKVNIERSCTAIKRLNAGRKLRYQGLFDVLLDRYQVVDPKETLMTVVREHGIDAINAPNAKHYSGIANRAVDKNLADALIAEHSLARSR